MSAKNEHESLRQDPHDATGLPDPIWQSGKAAIYCCDCYELLESWPDDAALVTDPPYGIGYAHGGGGRGFHEKRFNRKESKIIKSEPFAKRKIIGDDKPFDPAPFLRFKKICLWGADKYRLRLPATGVFLAWDKKAHLAFKTSFCDCEFAWTNGKTKRNIVSHLWKGMVKQTIGEDKYSRAGWGAAMPKLHPSQKPVRVCEFSLAAAGVEPGDTVIDPFMGSGSMGVAAHRAGCNYIGVEIDPEYCAIARGRLERVQAL